MLKQSIIGLALIAGAIAAPALAQAPMGPAGTVNAYTAAQAQKARAAATRQGYQVGAPTMFQDGNVFFNGSKAGQTITTVMVGADGQVYAGAAGPPAPAPAAPTAAPAAAPR